MRSSKTTKPRNTWFMAASRHNEVAELLKEDHLTFVFNPRDEAVCEQDYDTNIMGRFTCHNQRCSSNGWSSRKVAITIRMYSGRRYNARIYSQRCKACGWICRPTLDASYAERVSYRLKKWSGIDLTPPPFSDREGLPHRHDLCEGCRAGHCSEAQVWEFLQ